MLYTWCWESSFELLNVFQEVLTALESFSCYHHIWQRDKEETINKLMEGNPSLYEFESEILHFQDLDLKISSEPEYICVGAIALYTGRVQIFSRDVFFLTPVGRRDVTVLDGWTRLKWKGEREREGLFAALAVNAANKTLTQEYLWGSAGVYYLIWIHLFTYEVASRW